MILKVIHGDTALRHTF